MAKKAKQKVLGATYDSGMPETKLSWRTNATGRKGMLKYLETGERYFFAKEGVGSEKRKKPA
jgi:hypothetical protein